MPALKLSRYDDYCALCRAACGGTTLPGDEKFLRNGIFVI